MAIWDRPRHIRVDLQENLALEAYGESQAKAEKALEAYVGTQQLDEWRRKDELKSEDYRGDKKGVELNYHRIAREGDVPLPTPPERIVVRASESRDPAWAQANARPVSPAEASGPVHVERVPEKGLVVININLAEFDAPGKNPSARLQEEYRTTLTTVLSRVDALERQFADRDAQLSPDAQRGERRREVERAAGDSLPGEVITQTQRAAVRQAVADEFQVSPNQRSEERSPTASAPGNEFRGTIVEALHEAEKRGVTAYVLADRATDPHPRADSPAELARMVERVRDQLAPEAKDLRVYTVRDDGAIHNTVTKRDEFVPVAPAAPQHAASGQRLDRDGPREGPAPGGKAEREHHADQPEVSVSMA